MKALFFLLLLLFSMPTLAAVDLNAASQRELQSVKGIGPARARAIVEYRLRHGPFRTLDELRQVPGFGPRTVERLRRELTPGPLMFPAPR
ncbi:ComEA family DNA-binding protein [Paludibacterium yongneupense]|uniref:ComEA family DNA-binding protein n=1 Tax=Paludibacterium yongneupense TaxID=400061 RepID=UPI000423C067|nr:ComEA family DNA-binding protein [Paludibacterium yongneupense]